MTGVYSSMQRWPPIWRIIKSPPVWTLLLMQYSSMWGVFFNITAAPMFLHAVLGFRLTSTGLLGSLPHLSRWIASLLFAFFTDYVRRRNLCSTMNLRRILAVMC